MPMRTAAVYAALDRFDRLMLVLLGLLQATPPPLANARVRAGAAGGYHVDAVTLLDAELVATIRDAYVPGSHHASLGTGDYGGALRFAGNRGLLAVVQNPFLQFRRDGNAFAIRYQPGMDWRAEYGPFRSDRGLLAPVRRSGRYVPARMLPE